MYACRCPGKRGRGSSLLRPHRKETARNFSTAYEPVLSMTVANRAIDGRGYRQVSWTRLRARSGPIYGREHMKHIAGICSLCLLLTAWPASSADCDNWNTKEFFKTATPKAVTGCLQAGADPKARDEAVGGTPCIGRPGSTKTPLSSPRYWTRVPTPRRGMNSSAHLPCIRRPGTITTLLSSPHC